MGPSADGDPGAYFNARGMMARPSGYNYTVLGPCTQLGLIQGEQPGFSWTDPDDVVLNNSTLCQWNQTALVRKEGTSYPTSTTDGTILVTTSKADGNKNYYRDHTFTDTTAVSGVTYRYKLFSQTEAGIWNALPANEYTDGTGLSWVQVQQYVRAGRGAELFPVGTVFQVTHGDFQHDDGTGLYFRVVGHDQIPAADESLTHTMALECTECIAQLPFDATELQYALTDDTVYQSGKTYYKLSGTTYTAMVAGTDYQVGDTIPVATVYELNFGARYDAVNYGGGSNNWKESNVRQWLNSSGNAGSWFTEQNIWDLCATDLQNRDGFCLNIDQDFLAVIKQAKNSYTDEPTMTVSTVNDKMFLLGTDQLCDSGASLLQYYANGGSRIKSLINTVSAVNYRTRTMVQGTKYVQGQGCIVGYIDTDGNKFVTYTNSNTRANRSIGIAPACIIA